MLLVTWGVPASSEVISVMVERTLDAQSWVAGGTLAWQITPGWGLFPSRDTEPTGLALLQGGALTTKDPPSRGSRE